MSKYSLYREVDLRRVDEAAIHLADILSSHHAVSVASNGSSIFPEHASEVFAKGRFRAQTVRPLMQYFDCDMELVSDLSIKGYHPPCLCIGLLLKGEWQSVVNGNTVDMPGEGIPGFMACGETFEAVTKQSVGQRCRMAALSIDADFFSTQDNEDEPLWRGLAAHLKSDYRQYGLPNCGVLKSILQRLYYNPYQGAIGRLYAESLTLTALVELAVHIDGGHYHRTNLAPHRDQVHEARRILDEDLAGAPPNAELARRVGMSEITLRRAFKATFGITIIDYVRDRRLDAARVMLRDGRLQVAEIAYRVGYSDPANFTNAYRRRFGNPPTAELKPFKG
jgi:AraC-like DNA-binding protein